MHASPSNNPGAWLAEVITQFHCQTGTLHRSQDGKTLQLVASLGVPEHLLSVIDQIPFGKGIAGAAASTRKPVELCNLQKDLGGVAKEKARETKVAGSLAVPIFSADHQTVIGTLGVGMVQPYEFSAEEKAALAEQAKTIASCWETLA